MNIQTHAQKILDICEAGPIGGGVKLKIQAEAQSILELSPQDETRRAKQNRLMWDWNGQLGKAMGVSPDYAHGLCKLEILLPYMLTEKNLHKRAAFVQEVLRHVILYKHKIMVAYDMVRSKDLSVKNFAAYLTAVDRHYASQGIVLISPDDLRAEALYQADRKAA